MKKRTLTLIEVLESPQFQFWFLFLAAIAFYAVLRFPNVDELLLLCGVSFVATCGILGVIFLTEHADNPFGKPGLWVKAFVASLTAFSICLTIGPLVWWIPIVLVIPAVLQGFALSLAVEEDFDRCFWWSFGGEGLVVAVALLAAYVLSAVGIVIG